MQNPYTKEKDINTAKERLEDYAESAARQGEEKARHLASEAERKVRQGGEKVRHFAEDAEDKLKQGQERVKQFVSSADDQLHDNPWPIVGAVAAACLLLGFIMGSSKRD